MPPELQDVNSEISSTSVQNTQDVTSNSSPTSDANPPSSSGPDAASNSSIENKSTETREDLLSVMKSAVEDFNKPADAQKDNPSEASKDASADPKSQDTANKAPDAAKDPASQDATPKDPTDIPADELSKYSAGAQGRIRDLIKANKDLRTQYEATAPIAEGHKQLTGYMAQNSLGNEDVNLLLHVGSSLRRGDFQGFLKAVEPYVTAAKEALAQLMHQH